jgi:hypothetical protein
MITMKRKFKFDEDGAISGGAITIISGMAVIAIIAALWIGNTTSGLAADTAACVNSVAGPTAADPDCGSNSATGAGGGNAAAANDSRALPPSYIDDYGAGSGAYDTAKLNKANNNLERGILRFSGLKLTLYNDVQGSLNKLKTAPSKEAALAALQELRITIYAAQRDGETSTSESTIQVAANLLRDIKHPAADIAQAAQSQAQTGNMFTRDAFEIVAGGMDNYSTLSLSQMRNLSTSVDSKLKNAADNYTPSVAGLNEALKSVKANR